MWPLSSAESQCALCQTVVVTNRDAGLNEGCANTRHGPRPRRPVTSRRWIVLVGEDLAALTREQSAWMCTGSSWKAWPMSDASSTTFWSSSSAAAAAAQAGAWPPCLFGASGGLDRLAEKHETEIRDFVNAPAQHGCRAADALAYLARNLSRRGAGCIPRWRRTVCGRRPARIADRPALITTAKTGLGSVAARTVEAVAARTADGIFGVAGWSPDTEAGEGSMDWMPLGDYRLSGIGREARAWGPQSREWRAWFSGKIVDGLCGTRRGTSCGVVVFQPRSAACPG